MRMDLYPPPPLYSEEDSTRRPSPESNPGQFRVNRKPLPTKPTESESLRKSHRHAVIIGGTEDLGRTPPELSPRPELSLQTSVLPNITNSQIYDSPKNTRPSGGGISIASDQESTSTRSFPLSSTASVSTPDSSTTPQSSTSFILKAFQETRHFAGGLISHPTESTKHYTILRHSHGLVFYKGSNTSLAITIFSDDTLPIDRTLWLQSKGWSGKTGMRAKAFMGRNGNWLDVTPTTAVGTEQLDPHDERAWQRDIAKFQKKGHPKIREKHIPRETAVVRIPAEARDGYFQLVMCIGDRKKILCTSPTFRLLSTSASPSSMRGASLSLLPLELAAQIGSMALGVYASNTAGAIIAPVTSVVQGSVEKYMPSFWTQQAVTTAYGYAEETATTIIQEGNIRYDQTREQLLAKAEALEVALEEGPKAPYPINFKGHTQIGANNMAEELNLPVFGLSGVDDSVVQKLHGYYFGWARDADKAGKNETTWCQAIISVVPIDPSQLPRAKVAHINKKTITIRLISDESLLLNGATFDIQVLGFIRPDDPIQQATLRQGILAGDEAAHEAAMLTEVNDVQMAQEILDHPSWSAEASVHPKLQERKSSGLQKLAEGYATTRLAAHKQLDRVPLRKIGVRLEADRVKDKAIVASGFYVIR